MLSKMFFNFIKFIQNIFIYIPNYCLLFIGKKEPNNKYNSRKYNYIWSGFSVVQSLEDLETFGLSFEHHDYLSKKNKIVEKFSTARQ